MASIVKSIGQSMVTYLNSLNTATWPIPNWNTTAPVTWRREMSYDAKELGDNVRVIVVTDPEQSYEPSEFLDRCAGPFQYIVGVMILKRLTSTPDTTDQDEYSRIVETELDPLTELVEDLANTIWARSQFDGQSGCLHDVVEVDIPLAYDPEALQKYRTFQSLIAVRIA